MQGKYQDNVFPSPSFSQLVHVTMEHIPPHWQSCFLGHSVSCSPNPRRAVRLTPIISALRRLKQEDGHKFKAGQSYQESVSCSPSWLGTLCVAKDDPEITTLLLPRPKGWKDVCTTSHYNSCFELCTAVPW